MIGFYRRLRRTHDWSAMPHVFAQVRIPHANNLPADAVINGFHFTGVDDLEDMVTAIQGRLFAFYATAPPLSTYAVGRWMSGELNFTGARVRFYDWADPEPRAPIADNGMSLGTIVRASSLNMPGEVALCTSYRGALVSGGIAARRRGRLYIGPLNAGAMAGQDLNPSRPDGAFMLALHGATKRLATANTLGAQWVVWSRVNESATEIEAGWVDNAFDNQRRRGVEATTRNNWIVEIP